MKFWRLFTLVALLATTACSETGQQCAALIGGGSYCLQPTNAVAPFDVQQKVDSRFRDRRDMLIVELEVDAGGLRFAGLTPFGQKLIQLSYDNHTASASTIPDSRFNPTLLVALLQLALWPADAVRAGLEAPLTLEESAGQRRILNRGEATLTIEHDGEQPPWRKIRMTVPSVDLELSIENLDVKPAAVNAQ